MTSNVVQSAPTLNGHPPHDKIQKEWQIVQLDAKSIVPSPFQPRENFDEAELDELAQSIKAYGVQQPILVRPLESHGKKPSYELVAGERRWRATQLAGRKTIPAIVREMSDLAAAEIAVIENVQRANLSIIEEARGYKQLALRFRLNETRISKKVGKSVNTIREMLRLLALPEGVQSLIAKRQLTAAHGHELLRLAAHPKICEAVALRAVRDKLTATSMVANVLPNAHELKRVGQLSELGYGTKFDWRSVCKECPHKAFISVGYGSYCLRPDEWKRKQDEAIEVQQQEAAKIMEEARQQNDGTVEAEKISRFSHRRLLHVQLPAGCCESCECRSETFDETDPMRRVPICLNPERFDQLREAERQANEEARKRRYSQEWKEAAENLGGENGCSLVAALLVWPILQGNYRGYTQPDVWRSFVQSIASHLEIELPWNQLLDEPFAALEGFKRLREVSPQKMLVLGAGLLLGQEAERAIRFPGDTPQLDFVLGREKAVQTEIENDDEETQELEDYEGYAESYEDDSEVETSSDDISAIPVEN